MVDRDLHYILILFDLLEDIYGSVTGTAGNTTPLNKWMPSGTTTSNNGDLALAPIPTNSILLTPKADSFTHVDVNGLMVRVADGFDPNTGFDLQGKRFDCWFSASPGLYPASSSGANVVTMGGSDFTDLGLSVGDIVEIRSGASRFSRRVVSLGVNTVGYDSSDIPTATQIGKINPKAMADIVAGDQLRWHGANAGYQIVPTDNISFHYTT